jgi:hypothetical protein
MGFAVKPCCQLRQDLAGEYATAARLYAEAVAICTQSVDPSGFEQLRIKAREAQERAESARVMFEEHVAFHQF